MVGVVGTMMGSYGGSSLTAHNVLIKKIDYYRALFMKQPEVQREVDYFKKTIGTIKSSQELVDNQRLLKFVLTGFGLESQTFAKAMIRKMLDQSTLDPKSMVNQMIDRRYRDFAKFMSMDTKGTANFGDAEWVTQATNGYLTAAFELEVGETNPNLRLALYFDRRAPTLTSWYQVLGDKALAEVARGISGFSSSTAQIDVDKQVDMFKQKIDMADFADPAKRSKMIQKFLARADAENSQAALANDPTLQLLNAQPLTGYGPIIGMDASLLLKLQG